MAGECWTGPEASRLSGLDKMTVELFIAAAFVASLVIEIVTY